MKITLYNYENQINECVAYCTDSKLIYGYNKKNNKTDLFKLLDDNFEELILVDDPFEEYNNYKYILENTSCKVIKIFTYDQNIFNDYAEIGNNLHEFFKNKDDPNLKNKLLLPLDPKNIPLHSGGTFMQTLILEKCINTNLNNNSSDTIDNFIKGCQITGRSIGNTIEFLTNKIKMTDLFDKLENIGEYSNDIYNNLIYLDNEKIEKKWTIQKDFNDYFILFNGEIDLAHNYWNYLKKYDYVNCFIIYQYFNNKIITKFIFDLFNHYDTIDTNIDFLEFNNKNDLLSFIDNFN